MKKNTKSKKTRTPLKTKTLAAKLKAKRKVQARRPLHKAIALHPINLLVLLCVGVLLAVASFKTLADSYTVTGVVPAAGLTQPAVIEQPTDNQQVSPQVTTISGTCPYVSYVNVTDNGNLVGTAICSLTGTFQITDSLYVGANVLNAQDYNVTNSPGPSSPDITVYYYSTPTNNNQGNQNNNTQSQQPAVVPPPGIQIIQVDTGIPFISPTVTQIVSDEPTLTGVAPPYSLVLITIHSNPYYCHTYANSQGFWSCTFSEVLPATLHNVTVTAMTASGSTITYPNFQLKIVPVPPKSQQAAPKFNISANYTYKVYIENQLVTVTLNVKGGAPPYAATIDWGDGTTDTYLWQTASSHSVSHTYKSLNVPAGSEHVKVESIDTDGQVSTIQMDLAVKNPNYKAKGSKPNFILGIIDDIKPWLIVIWPGYLICLLMVLAFWLGERQEITRILRGRKPKSPLQHHGPRW